MGITPEPFVLRNYAATHRIRSTYYDFYIVKYSICQHFIAPTPHLLTSFVNGPLDICPQYADRETHLTIYVHAKGTEMFLFLKLQTG